MVLRQIQKGKLVPVAPSKFASGEVIYPETQSGRIAKPYKSKPPAPA